MPVQCLHPAGPNRTGKLGEYVYTGCPALAVTPLDRQAYELYHLCHRRAGPGWQLTYTVHDLWTWPTVVIQAFNVIESELAQLAAEPKE